MSRRGWKNFIRRPGMVERIGSYLGTSFPLFHGLNITTCGLQWSTLCLPVFPWPMSHQTSLDSIFYLGSVVWHNICQDNISRSLNSVLATVKIPSAELSWGEHNLQKMFLWPQSPFIIHSFHHIQCTVGVAARVDCCRRCFVAVSTDPATSH